MEVETIIEIYNKVNNKDLILRRYLEEVPSIVKAMRYYIIELWDKDTKTLLLQTKEQGQWVPERTQEIISKAEERFIQSLFELGRS